MPIRETGLPELLDKQFLQHLRQLGIATVHEYRQCCVDHGFSRGLNKHSTMRAAEVAVRIEPTLATNAQRRHEARKPLVIMLSICDGKLSAKDVHQVHLLRFSKLIHEASQSKQEPSLEPFVLGQLLRRLMVVRARFLDSCVACIENAADESNLLRALILICQNRFL